MRLLSFRVCLFSLSLMDKMVKIHYKAYFGFTFKFSLLFLLKITSSLEQNFTIKTIKNLILANNLN